MGQRVGFSSYDLEKINAMYCKQQNGPNKPVKRPPRVPSGSPVYPNLGFNPSYYPDFYPDYPNYGAPYPPNYPNYLQYGPPGPGFYPQGPFPQPGPFPWKDENEV